MSHNCFHCNEVIPNNTAIASYFSDRCYDFCCYGCLAVFDELCHLGHFDYYSKRTHSSQRPLNEIFQSLSSTSKLDVENSNVVRESSTIDQDNTDFFTSFFTQQFLSKTKIYDNPSLLKEYAENIHEDLQQCHFDVYDMSCSACAWLIEKRLAKINGIEKFSLNFTNESLDITWNKHQIQLSEIILLIQKIGYRVLPHKLNSNKKKIPNSQGLLKKLGITALFAMQIMVLSVAMYAGDYQGMDDEYRILMQKASMLLSFPIVIYSAQTFFSSAWRALKNHSINMDVPISIAIVLAFCTSIYHTILNNSMITANTGNDLYDVYYDSISMLIFFLLLSRFYEAKAKAKTNHTVDRLSEAMPLTASRFKNNNIEKDDIENIPAKSLEENDIILIKRGEACPADGEILKGSSTFNQSVISGESEDILLKKNDEIITGSINTGSDVIAICRKVGKESTLYKIQNLAQQSQSQKPKINQYVDQIAKYFTLCLLVLALMTAIFWYYHDPQRWIQITLAVLVITCPCALSLATPVSIAACISRLLDKGILLKDVDAIQTLNKVKEVVFDKTGTLTTGKLSIAKIQLYHQDDMINHHNAIAILKTLEKNASHSIAHAIQQIPVDFELANPHFSTASNIQSKLFKMENIVQHHHGIQAQLWHKDNGNMKADSVNIYFGNLAYITEKTNLNKDDIEAFVSKQLADSEDNIMENIQDKQYLPSSISILVSCDGNTSSIRLACYFVDSLNDNVKNTLDFLRQKELQISLLSGDNLRAVKSVAQNLNIENYHAQKSPQDKFEYIQARQQTHPLLMVGDGVNDAPVLAAADCSIAVKNASNYAISEADIILVKDDFYIIKDAFESIHLTNKIIIQNLSWSLLYNITSIPLAVMGYIHPLIAAIGMSLSSLVVVLNALRILKS